MCRAGRPSGRARTAATRRPPSGSASGWRAPSGILPVGGGRLGPVRSARYIARLMAYEHRTVEPRWQARWREAGLHRTPTDPAKPKFYALDMFPYPSGSGLHVGHCEGYTATDVITRW